MTYINIVHWVLIALFALNIPLTTATIGKPREPISPQSGAVVVVINALVLAALLLERFA
jgi:hypothetical protein